MYFFHPSTPLPCWQPNATPRDPAGTFRTNISPLFGNVVDQFAQFSKIGKVMRHINALPKDKVPRDDEFRFKDRAKALVDKWHEILNENKGSSKANGIAVAGESAKAATNGTSPDAKGAGAADAGATTSGQEDEKPKIEVSDSAMEVDQEAPKTVTDNAAPTAKNESGDADAEAETNEDAPADPAADESALADVTMSEAA